MLECAEFLVGLIFCKDQKQNTETLQQSNRLTLDTLCEDLPNPKPKVTKQATRGESQLLAMAELWLKV